MKTKPWTYTKGPLTRTVFTPSSTMLLGENDAITTVLHASGIVKGDKHNPNPWSYNIEKHVAFKGVAYDQQGTYGGDFKPIYSKFTGQLKGPRVPDLRASSKASLAYNKALDKLNDEVRGGLDLSVAMAESSATFRMVRALSTTKRYFSGIGSKRWANEWLELQYGWLPLLSDVYGAAEEIIHVNLGLMYFKGRGSNSETTSKNLSTAAHIDISGVNHLTEFPVTTKSKIKVYNACELKVLMAPPTNLQAVARWSSLNPVSIAWELVPYSFVFDWFFDVGSWLRNMETSILYNSSFRGGYRSELFVGEHLSTVGYLNKDPYFTKVVSLNATASGEIKTFSRTLLTQYPLPRMPVIQTDLSAKRLLSAASLLRQFLK